MPRLFSIAAMAAVVVVTGCDSTDSASVNECTNLRGTYAASTMAFENVEDPEMRETLTDDEEFQLTFRGNQFVSRYVSSQQDTLQVEGYYTVDREAVPAELSLGDTALIPGMDSSDQTFTCESEELGFKLSNEGLNYDLDKNGEYETTRLTSEFSLISRL